MTYVQVFLELKTLKKDLNLVIVTTTILLATNKNRNVVLRFMVP